MKTMTTRMGMLVMAAALVAAIGCELPEDPNAVSGPENCVPGDEGCDGTIDPAGDEQAGAAATSGDPAAGQGDEGVDEAAQEAAAAAKLPAGPFCVYDVTLVWGKKHFMPKHWGDIVSWNGGARLRGAKGVMVLKDLIRFDKHDAVLMETPRVIAWRSHTNVHNDGVQLRLAVHCQDRKARLEVQTESYERSFNLYQLAEGAALFNIGELSDHFWIKVHKKGEVTPKVEQDAMDMVL